ncbi:autotransporter-associated beta strand repeat-containing protein [Synoicihabitans lomoniglobus]|uniref:Autotransporter-associated beta strand repeat-containing protein n=1 Tax=Synoicihabitans lomoniglobus TaxID=2909285 RepID=A0AAE9ZWI7_9BACT|nr:autotransporter-associated beta strand repeat-containing protein [Opitutaceae bacterium LMO-M01]WED65566.1 autotransporter-associated beta strand repeat-containing protein [Opitutaceae bacterium LMO-M01]
MNFALPLPVLCSPPAGARSRRSPALRVSLLFLALSLPAFTSRGQYFHPEIILYQDGVQPDNVYNTDPAETPGDTFDFILRAAPGTTVTELGELRTRYRGNYIPWQYENPPVNFYIAEGNTLIMDWANFGGQKSPQNDPYWAGANVYVQYDLFGVRPTGTVIFNRDFDISGGYAIQAGTGKAGGNLSVKSQGTVIFKGNFNSQGAYNGRSGDILLSNATVEFQGNVNNRSSDMLEGNAVMLHQSGPAGNIAITDSIVTFRGMVDSSVSRPDIFSAYDGGDHVISGSNSVVTFEQRVDQSGDGKNNRQEYDTGVGGALTISDGATVGYLGDLVSNGAAGGTAGGNGGGITISGPGTAVTFEGTVSRLPGLRSDNGAGRGGNFTLSGGTARFETGSALQIAREDGAGTAGILKLQGGTLEVPTLGWLTDPNSFRGAMTFTTGTLRTTASSAGAPVSLGASSALGAGFNTAATGDRTLDTKDNLTFDATVALNGAGSFTKAGTGTLTLAGVHTYTGDTVVSGGTLVINGFLASDTVSIGSGTTLGGSGSFGGLVTLQAGATLAPGNSPGTITFTDGLTLIDGSILDFELGTLSDMIAVTGGTLTGPSDGTVTLNFTNSGGFTAGTYTLFDFSSGATTLSNFDLTDFAFGSLISGYDYSLNFFGDTLQLTSVTSAVPEPATCAILFGFTALSFASIRRRRLYHNSCYRSTRLLNSRATPPKTSPPCRRR